MTLRAHLSAATLKLVDLRLLRERAEFRLCVIIENWHLLPIPDHGKLFKAMLVAYPKRPTVNLRLGSPRWNGADQCFYLFSWIAGMTGATQRCHVPQGLVVMKA